MPEQHDTYLMEHADEAKRLDIKTDPEAVRAQARLCGIGPGARVLDVGCGSGKAASILHAMVGPRGEVVGVDYSEERLHYARQAFGGKAGLSFRRADITKSMADLGTFDFIWIRFVLEYFLAEAPAIIANITRNLGPEGRLCLLDLDHNSLNHYPLPGHMQTILQGLLDSMAAKNNFDPYMGRKLYRYLYDLHYRAIEVQLAAHHLIYGALRPEDAFNWTQKLHQSAKLHPEVFEDYPGGMQTYFDDFLRFFSDEGRFTYTPLIICTGLKPCAAT